MNMAATYSGRKLLGLARDLPNGYQLSMDGDEAVLLGPGKWSSRKIELGRYPAEELPAGGILSLARSNHAKIRNHRLRTRLDDLHGKGYALPGGSAPACLTGPDGRTLAVYRSSRIAERHPEIVVERIEEDMSQTREGLMDVLRARGWTPVPQPDGTVNTYGPGGALRCTINGSEQLESTLSRHTREAYEELVTTQRNKIMD